jgi:glycosyltransferase involved in cell wall biosynthesis
LAAALHHRGIELVPWRTHDATGERLPLGALRADLEKIIRHARADLLHANSLSTARISGPVAAETRTRSIGHLRDILKLSLQAIDDINQHRRLIAVSQATRDFHVDRGLAAEKCVVINNGVDLDQFRRRPATGYIHRELGLPPNVRFCAIIGQLGLRKGTDVALAAALQLAEKQPDVHWLVVGERNSNKDESREFEQSLKSTANKLPLADRVHFLGPRADVDQLLPECDLLVHAARQEPLGRVLLEAAASGTPIVATDVGGTREIFPSEAAGAILVPVDDPATLADSALAVVGDENRRKSLAAAGRRRAEAAFDIRVAANHLVEQYYSVLA